MTDLDAENQIFKETHPRVAPIDASTFEYAPDSLIYAVKKKNKNELDRLLASGFQINSRDADDVSLLHYAVKTGDPEFFEYVISKKPLVNVVSRDETILMTAASKKNEQIIRILIENGATQDFVSAKGKTALDFGNESARKVLVNYTGDDLKSKRKICEAAREDNTEEVMYLLAKGSSINEKDNDGMTPYLYACKNGNLKLLSILTKLGCNEEVSDSDGHNGAFLATLNKQHKILKFLYLRGIDFKFAIKGETMLHVAIINNDFDTVKYLLDLKFDQSIRNKEGLSSLFYAISLDRDKIIPLVYNEKSNGETYNDMNPVMFAVEKNRLNTLKRLVELKCDIRYRNQQGFDPFMLAVKNGFINIANFLIESGIDVNEHGPGGDSALMTAIRYSNLEMQKFILYKNCSLTTENKTRENCYQYCVLYKKYDILNILLQKANDQTYQMAKKSLYMAIEANDFQSTKILVDFFNRENKDPYDCLVKYAKTQEMRAFLIQADQNDIKLKVKKGRTIFDSCSENFVQEIKYFIVQSEGNLEIRNPSGWTPLIMAAGCGQIDSVKFLVSIGADRYAKTNGGSTAISIATQYGYTKIIDYLMSVGLSPNDFVSGGQNCLCLAASEGKIDVVKFFIEEKSIDINERNQFGKKPIFCATEKGRNEVVQYLISKGADVNEIGIDGIPLSFLAYQKGQSEVYKTLIENGAQTNVNDKNGLNMLHYAATKNDIETAQKCIENGADINKARESDHLTPYLIACYSGSLEFLQFLEQKGAVFDLESCNGVGPLYAASEGGHLNVVQYLIEVKNIKSKKDLHGMTPLLVACKFGHENIVDYLLTKGSDCSERDNENCSALYYACQNGSLSLVKKLVESKKFDVNEKCWNGNTCLHVACLNGNADVVKYLIRKKASLDQRTKSDSLPIHLAAQNNHSGVLKVLLNANKEMIDKRGYNYNTPLTIACLNEAYDAAKFLMQSGAKINARNVTRLSVMHLSAAEGRIYLIRELLKLGFDVNERLDNETPLGRASMHCQWDTVTFLLSNGAVKENTKAYSALHRCVAEDRMNHFKKLLTLGFKIEEKGIEGRTPLVTAILNKNMDFIDYFIESNVEINAKDDENKTPIYHAITVNSKEILEKLIQNGCLINYQRLQDTPVIFAISNSNSDMLEILMDSGADPNLDSKIGKFPVHFAAMKDDSNFLQVLSKYETNYNVKDREFEFTPLVMSIVNKKEVNTKWLLNRKVDVTIKDKKGKSAFYYAISNLLLDTAEEIRKLGGDVNEKDANDNPIIIYCLKNNLRDAVFYLLDHGVDINSKSKSGNTILIKALTKKSDKEMAIKIIEKGADPNIPSKFGEYPIHICIKNNYPDIVELLISHDCKLNVQNNDGLYPLTLTNWETVDDKSLAKLLKKSGAKDICFEKMCEDKNLQFEHQEAINEKRKQMLEQTSIELDKDYETIEKQKDEKMTEISKLENDLKEYQTKKEVQPPPEQSEIEKIDAAVSQIQSELTKKGVEINRILESEHEIIRKKEVYTADVNKLQSDVEQLKKDREDLQKRIEAYDALGA